MAETRPKAIIVGCGIIGLSTGVCIQESISNVDVTIFADAFLHDTTSIGAAGIIRISSLNGPLTPCEEIGRRWFQDTYSHCARIFQSADGGKAGISRIHGYNISETEEGIVKCDGLEPKDGEIFKLPSHNIMAMFPNTSAKVGNLVTTFVVDSTHYLPYLQEKFLKNGGKIEKRTIKSLAEFAGQCDVVINCSGLRAQKLVGDPKIHGIRGQVLKVKAPWIKHFYYNSLETYIIPGIDYVTIGGTRQFTESTNTEINPLDSVGMMDRAVKVMPSLKNAEVVKQWVGIRPTRHPIRLEKQILRFGNDEVKVVHNYGHGGNGVTFSWGTAKHATELVLEFLNGLRNIKVTPASIPSSL